MASPTVIIAGNLAWSIPVIFILLYLTKRLATNRRFQACQLPLLSECVSVLHSCPLDLSGFLST